MTDHDRREFLKRLAKTTAYVAPVVYSLAAPVDLIGQGMSSMHKPMKGAAATQQAPSGTQQPGGQAPWDRPPPGGKVP